MTKLGINGLRQRAIDTDEARKTEAAFRRGLLDGVVAT